MAFNASTYTSSSPYQYNFEGQENINISFKKIGLGANKAEVREPFPIVKVDSFENTTVDEIIKSLIPQIIPQNIFLQDKKGYNVKLKVTVGVLDDTKGSSSSSSPFRPHRRDSSKRGSKLKKVKSKSVKRSRKPHRQ
jgi:hypothetical protein